MNELAEQKNLEVVGKRVRRISDEAYARFLNEIRKNELSSIVTQDIILGYFANEFYKLLRNEFTKDLYESLGDLKIQDYPVGRIKLSDKLFHHAHSTSLIVRRIVQKHANDFHVARNLALQLFQGYDFKVDPLQVKKQLPKYLFKPLAKLQAKQLKTPALKAAYLQLIDKIEAGQGFDQLDKVLNIAFNERNRYFANRIAQTELHRSYTDKRARELMEDADVEYIQLRLSTKHPRVDICFRKGTLISTDNGHTPIENVNPGMMVFTHTGKLNKVIGVSKTSISVFSSMRKITAQTKSGQYIQVISTPNHPFLTDKGWIRASDLKKGCRVLLGGFLVQSRLPFCDVSDITPSDFLESLPYMSQKISPLGLYDVRRYFLSFCIPRMNYLYFLKPISLRNFGGYIFRCFYFPLANSGFYRRFETQTCVLGNYQNGETCQVYASRNLDCVRQLKNIFLNSRFFHVPAIKKYFRKLDKFEFCINHNNIFELVSRLKKYTGILRKYFQSFVSNSNIKTGVVISNTEIKSVGENVYNLAVDEDHSYIANGFIVHNCDLYAKMDKYGLGPGVYPKDQAPKPPFHPHCLCVAVPRIDIFDKKPREKQNAEGAFIRSKTKSDGAAIAGSFAKRERVLIGEKVIDIQNEGKDPLYHLKLIGEFDEER